MYRTDHVFRGLVDMSVAGALILAFSGSLSLSWPAMGHLTGLLKQSVSPIVRSVLPDRETMAPGRLAGGMSHDTLAADPTLRDGGLVDDAAKEAQAAMDRGGLRHGPRHCRILDAEKRGFGALGALSAHRQRRSPAATRMKRAAYP